LAGAEDHWLIPDNLQEDRRELVAHRTSPTNIGLQLLATLAAYDFGYLNAPELITRLERTFATLLRMPRYRGHFYNWYDTRTLVALPPAYISTVDSGNLAGYLMTLRIGLLELASEPVISPSFLEGLEDLVNLVEDELERARARRATSGTLSGLRKELARLRVALSQRPSTADAWKALLVQIRDRLAGIGVLFHELDESPSGEGGDAAAPPLADAGYWLDQAAAVVAARLDELAGRGPARAELIERAERLAALADDLVVETEFGFLFDEERQLFSIGFNVVDGRLDSSYYDTLASEARLASFVAIATGQIAHEHWFKLGRSLTPSGASRSPSCWLRWGGRSVGGFIFNAL
jgi:hypothetical protein